MSEMPFSIWVPEIISLLRYISSMDKMATTGIQCANFDWQYTLLIIMIIFSSSLLSSPPLIQDISGIDKSTSEILIQLIQINSDQINVTTCQTNANVTGYPFR